MLRNSGLDFKVFFFRRICLFPKLMVPPKHPKMIIFSRKTHGCWVPLFLGKRPYVMFLVGIEAFSQGWNTHPFQNFQTDRSKAATLDLCNPCNQQAQVRVVWEIGGWKMPWDVKQKTWLKKQTCRKWSCETYSLNQNLQLGKKCERIASFVMFDQREY